jgi:hypothetical protein
MLQTLNLKKEKRKKSSFSEEKSFIGLTPGELLKGKKKSRNFFRKLFFQTTLFFAGLR